MNEYSGMQKQLKEGLTMQKFELSRRSLALPVSQAIGAEWATPSVLINDTSRATTSNSESARVDHSCDVTVTAGINVPGVKTHFDEKRQASDRNRQTQEWRLAVVGRMADKSKLKRRKLTIGKGRK